MRPLPTLTLASLLLGAASTVGVAWSMMYYAFTGPRPSRTGQEVFSSPREDRKAMVSEWRIHHHGVTMHALVPYELTLASMFALGGPGSPFVPPVPAERWDAGLTGWASRLREPWSARARQTVGHEHFASFPAAAASGWPCSALWCEGFAPDIGFNVPDGVPHPDFSFHHISSGAWEIGPPLDERPKWNFKGVIPLPYRILPTGFSICVATHSAAWFALFSTPSLLRSSKHRRRIRLGKCPACSYDLRDTPSTSPCPECGSLSPLNP